MTARRALGRTNWRKDVIPSPVSPISPTMRHQHGGSMEAVLSRRWLIPRDRSRRTLLIRPGTILIPMNPHLALRVRHHDPRGAESAQDGEVEIAARHQR